MPTDNDTSVGRSFNHEVDTASDPTANRLTDDALRALVRRAATDQDALSDLIRTCAPFVTHLCRRHARNGFDKDDLEQEVWLALVKSVASIDEPCAIYGWLKQVATRAAIAHSKKASREVPSGVTVAARVSVLEADTTSENILREESCEVVRVAMSRLPQQDRALLTLLAAEDRPDYTRVSESLKRPIGSIGPTRQRALVRLRRDRAMASLAD